MCAVLIARRPAPPLPHLRALSADGTPRPGRKRQQRGWRRASEQWRARWRRRRGDFGRVGWLLVISLADGRCAAQRRGGGGGVGGRQRRLTGAVRRARADSRRRDERSLTREDVSNTDGALTWTALLRAIASIPVRKKVACCSLRRVFSALVLYLLRVRCAKQPSERIAPRPTSLCLTWRTSQCLRVCDARGGTVGPPALRCAAGSHGGTCCATHPSHDTTSAQLEIRSSVPLL